VELIERPSYYQNGEFLRSQVVAYAAKVAGLLSRNGAR